jgi:hypothetical protein
MAGCQRIIVSKAILVMNRAGHHIGRPTPDEERENDV